MGKKTPQERWAEHIRERVIAFRNSKEFRRLRRSGLSVIGRTRLLGVPQYWQGWSQWLSIPEYMNWREKCRKAGEIFGLAQWTVELMCLLRHYRPDKSSLVAEVNWPKIEVVTGVENTQFQKWLCYWSRMFGLKVIFKKGPIETVLLWLDSAIQPPYGVPVPTTPPEELPVSNLPPKNIAFVMRVETPTGFPPEARAELQKEAARLERKLLLKLGYTNVHMRLRASSLVKKARILKVSIKKLPSRGLYQVAAETSGDETTEVDKDKQLVKTLKTQRHRVKKRFGQYK